MSLKIVRLKAMRLNLMSFKTESEFDGSKTQKIETILSFKILSVRSEVVSLLSFSFLFSHPMVSSTPACNQNNITLGPPVGGPFYLGSPQGT